MSLYRVPAAVFFRRAPRASWWRRNVVAWYRNIPRILAARRAGLRAARVLVNPRFRPGTQSWGPG